MLHNNIHKELKDILKTTKQIKYKGIILYLIDKSILDRVLALELTVRTDNEKNSIKKRNHFYNFAKIINPTHPALKYTLSMKHKKKEVFDPIKVQKTLLSEFEIWKNKSRVELEEEIKRMDSPLADEQAKNFREELEKEIISSKEKINTVLDNYEEYDVIISTFEYYTYYPSLYYVVADNQKNSASDTHLRQDVPNLLWFQDERPFSELRSNDKMSRIIQTFDRFCGSIYIKRR